MNERYDSRPDTLAHIQRVRRLLEQARHNLAARGMVHDASKLDSPEKECFDEITPRLATVTYGSDEYKETLREMKPAIEHHYRRNSHHPEHYENGIAGMSLFDLLEMLVDWKAASERHGPKVEAEAGERSGETPNILRSIAHNRERFAIEPQLVSVLENTVREFGWADTAAEARSGRGEHDASAGVG